MAKAVDGDDIINLSHALQALVGVGVPLDAGLRQVSSGMNSTLQQAATGLAERINRGETVEEALQGESTLPPVFRAIVTAGMEAGATQEILNDVCEVTQSLVELRSAVRRGMIYPLIVVAISLLLFASVMPFLVGAQIGVYETVRNEIPGWLSALQQMTQWLTPGNLSIGLIVLLAALLVWYILNGGRNLVSGLGWIPGARRVLRDADLSRTMHVLGIMLKYGVPVPQALRLAVPTSESSLHQRDLRGMADALERGEPLSQIVERQKSFPPFLRWMIAVGLQDSSLATALQQAGDFYQQRAISRARVLQSLVPALVIGVVAGGITLFYGVTVFAPLKSLWEVIGTPR